MAYRRLLHGEPSPPSAQLPTPSPPPASAAQQPHSPDPQLPALWRSATVAEWQHRFSESPTHHEEKSEAVEPRQASPTVADDQLRTTQSPATSFQRSPGRRPGRPDHPVWEHFVRKVKSNRKFAAVCRYCDRRLNTGQPERFMVPHLVACKKAPTRIRQQWSEFLSVETQRKQQRAQASAVAVTAGSAPAPAATTPMTFGNAPTAAPSCPFVTQEQFDFALAQMMFGCALSFVLVESLFFRQFIELLAPGIRLPSRHKLGGSILNDMRENCRKLVVALIKQQRVVSIVTDAWTDTNKSSIVNFMVVAPGMPALFWSSLPTGTNQHTGAFMAKELERVIDEVQSETGAVVAGVITDNASNMVNAWDRLKAKLPIFAGGCAAHTVNLLIQDIFKLDFFKTIREQCVTITKFVRDHHALLDEFRNLQSKIVQAHDEAADHFRSLHQSTTLPSRDRRRALVVPIQTRWYTVHACRRSVLSNVTIIKKLFSGQANGDLLARYALTASSRASLEKATLIVEDPEFWQNLEHAVKLIDPIVEVLRELESDKCPTSKVYALFRRLRTLDLYDKFNRALPPGLLTSIKRHINKRWEFVCTDAIKIAFLLDPATNTTDFMDDDMNDSVKAAVRFARHANLLGTTSEDAFTAALYAFGSLKRGWSAEDKAQYAAAAPSHWWDDNEQTYEKVFPKVYDLARLVFAVPTSSAASERAWSILDFIHSKKRNRLTKDKVEKLAYGYINLAVSSTSWIDLARLQEYPESVMGPENELVEDSA